MHRYEPRNVAQIAWRTVGTAALGDNIERRRWRGHQPATPLLDVTLAGNHDAIPAEQGNGLARRYVDRLVEALQVIRVDHTDDHAKIHAVDAVDAPCDRHDPFSRGTTARRTADEGARIIVIPKILEEITVGKIKSR